LTRKQTTQNRHLRPQKIRGFGLRRTREESADSVADSESVTTLKNMSINYATCFQLLFSLPGLKCCEMLTVKTLY